MTDERLDLVGKIKTIIIFAIKILGTMAGLKFTTHQIRPLSHSSNFDLLVVGIILLSSLQMPHWQQIHVFQFPSLGLLSI